MAKALNLSYDIGKTKQVFRFFYFSLQTIFIFLTFALAASLVAKNLQWSGVSSEPTAVHAAFNATLALSVFLILPFVFQFILIFIKKIPGKKYIDWALSAFNGLFLLFVIVTAALSNGFAKIYWGQTIALGGSTEGIQLVFQISASLLSFAIFAMICQVGFLGTSSNSKVSVERQEATYNSRNARNSDRSYGRDDDFDGQTLKIRESDATRRFDDDDHNPSAFYDVDPNHGRERRYVTDADDDDDHSSNAFTRGIKWTGDTLSKGAKDVVHGTENAAKWTGREVEKGAKGVVHGTEDAARWTGREAEKGTKAAYEDAKKATDWTAHEAQTGIKDTWNDTEKGVKDVAHGADTAAHDTIKDVEYVGRKVDDDVKEGASKSFKAVDHNIHDDDDEVVYGTHRVDDFEETDDDGKRSKKVKDFEVKDLKDLDF